MENCVHCNENPEPPDHQAELTRLSRIEGQLAGIRRMIEERRYCPDILTQVRAARAALHALEASLLESHLQCCVVSAFESQDEKKKAEKIEELKTIFLRFD